MEISLSQMPKQIKNVLTAFIFTATIGFSIGLFFINHTTHFKVKGIEQNYLGNEEDETADEMLFRKSEREILTTIHNHITSMSLLFLAVGLIFALTPIAKRYKWLAIEPFVSLFLTFGSIYFLWKFEWKWISYVTMISGIAMSTSFYIMVYFSLQSLLSKKR
ncbi:MAG TPA: hypothetical protein DIU39_10055 [Flavobacteriales bacterium]|nr:hypothetical protein [Flavobacteriales bacterium]|tara:strand:+ start:17956 stop:18441 length:486 start_codon:yes stop_codon:yes gene_type:complete